MWKKSFLRYGLGLFCLLVLLKPVFAGECKIVSVPNVDFGILDRYTSNNKTVTEYVTYWCSKDLPYKLVVDNGTTDPCDNYYLHPKDRQNQNQPRYSVSFNKYGKAENVLTGIGQGENVIIRTPITFKILTATQQLARGSYDDQLTLTLSS